MKDKAGSRGFITIATGNERYYRLAVNLLRSYRQFAKDPVPFALIADRENEYTREFDDVVIISDPDNSYNDKLKLYREMPYDETIFIDADSLAYGDLNAWWDMFADAGDFSLFGYAWRDLNCGRGWFVPEGMGKYRDSFSFIPDFNGGVYYMRRTETCARVFEIANECAAQYSDYQFRGFATPADEPVLALGMAVCGLEPLDLPGELVFAPTRQKLDADISVPRAVYKKSDTVQYPVRLVHFSNYRTTLSFYRGEIQKLEDLRNHRSTGRIKRAMSMGWYYLGDVAALYKRAAKKLKRVLRK